MFRPVTPDAPKVLKSHPPTTAPTTPRMMSRKKPSPDLLTILLPIKPATNPRTIHANIDIRILPLEIGNPCKCAPHYIRAQGPDGNPRIMIMHRAGMLNAETFGYNPRAHEPRTFQTLQP